LGTNGNDTERKTRKANLEKVLGPLFAEFDLRVDTTRAICLEVGPCLELSLSNALGNRPCGAAGEFDTALSTASLKGH
jgi:hypothetical protein